MERNKDNTLFGNFVYVSPRIYANVKEIHLYKYITFRKTVSIPAQKVP